MSIVSKVLHNGLQVIAVEAPGLQSVGIAVGVKYGSIDEDPRINGAAHFLEHMLYKGTKKRTWQDISNEVRSLGAYQNAMTDFETTTFMMQSFKGDTAKSMDIISDIIKNSTIPENEFNLDFCPKCHNLLSHPSIYLHSALSNAGYYSSKLLINYLYFR